MKIGAGAFDLFALLPFISPCNLLLTSSVLFLESCLSAAVVTAMHLEEWGEYSNKKIIETRVNAEEKACLCLLLLCLHAERSVS